MPISQKRAPKKLRGGGEDQYLAHMNREKLFTENSTTDPSFTTQVTIKNISTPTPTPTTYKLVSSKPATEWISCAMVSESKRKIVRVSVLNEILDDSYTDENGHKRVRCIVMFPTSTVHLIAFFIMDPILINDQAPSLASRAASFIRPFSSRAASYLPSRVKRVVPTASEAMYTLKLPYSGKVYTLCRRNQITSPLAINEINSSNVNPVDFYMYKKQVNVPLSTIEILLYPSKDPNTNTEILLLDPSKEPNSYIECLLFPHDTQDVDKFTKEYGHGIKLSLKNSLGTNKEHGIFAELHDGYARNITITLFPIDVYEASPAILFRMPDGSEIQLKIMIMFPYILPETLKPIYIKSGMRLPGTDAGDMVITNLKDNIYVIDKLKSPEDYIECILMDYTNMYRLSIYLKNRFSGSKYDRDQVLTGFYKDSDGRQHAINFLERYEIPGVLWILYPKERAQSEDDIILRPRIIIKTEFAWQGGAKRSIRYTIPQLKAIAASRGINLKGVTRKDDIKKRISQGL